jgi:hypothetical protein
LVLAVVLIGRACVVCCLPPRLSTIRSPKDSPGVSDPTMGGSQTPGSRTLDPCGETPHGVRPMLIFKIGTIFDRKSPKILS